MTRLECVSRIVAGLLLASVPFRSAAQAFKPLSPEGEKSLAEKAASGSAKFDEAAARKDAKAKYPIIHKGEKVSFISRGRNLSGAFQGIEGRYLTVDGKKISLIDIPDELQLSFDEPKSLNLREQFILDRKSEFEESRMLNESRLRSKLYAQYPELDWRLLSDSFASISDPAKRKGLMDEFEAFYNKSLPIEDESSPKDFAVSRLDAFVALHPELVCESAQIYMRIERASKTKRALELVQESVKRTSDRALMPKTATPRFEPDGGAFNPALPLIIHCPTPGAVIHYTCDGSMPDEESPVYDGPIKLVQPQLFRAIALHPEFNDSEVAQTAQWTGLGLYASYFPRMKLEGETVVKAERDVDFGWEDRPPILEMPQDEFVAVFAGSIVAPESGEYDIYVSADDMVRLWIDGELFIDNWTAGPFKEYHLKVSLETSRPCPIKLMYSDIKGLARLRLEWSGSHIPRTVIPQSSLASIGRYVEEMQKWNNKEGGAYVNRPSMKNPSESN